MGVSWLGMIKCDECERTTTCEIRMSESFRVYDFQVPGDELWVAVPSKGAPYSKPLQVLCPQCVKVPDSSR